MKAVSMTIKVGDRFQNNFGQCYTVTVTNGLNCLAFCDGHEPWATKLFKCSFVELRLIDKPVEEPLNVGDEFLSPGKELFVITKIEGKQVFCHVKGKPTNIGSCGVNQAKWWKANPGVPYVAHHIAAAAKPPTKARCLNP